MADCKRRPTYATGRTSCVSTQGLQVDRTKAIPASHNCNVSQPCSHNHRRCAYWVLNRWLLSRLVARYSHPVKTMAGSGVVGHPAQHCTRHAKRRHGRTRSTPSSTMVSTAHWRCSAKYFCCCFRFSYISVTAMYSSCGGGGDDCPVLSAVVDAMVRFVPVRVLCSFNCRSRCCRICRSV